MSERTRNDSRSNAEGSMPQDTFDVPDSLSPYGQRFQVPLDPEASSVRNTVGPGDLLAMMAASSTMPDTEVDVPTLTEHEIAAQLPPETTAVGAEGNMDNHRHPIVSINGKDVDEHERRDRAA